MGLTVLIIGNGAREHVISKAYENSSDVSKIIVAPGNDFITYNRQKEVISDSKCSLQDLQSIIKIALKYKPDLIDVAQDNALSLGAVDSLVSIGFNVFGPRKNTAEIEWNKSWSRQFMKKYKIPHPKFQSFNSQEEAKEYVELIYSQEPKKLIFVKAAGLCGGKGALKAESLEEAIRQIEQMRNFGDSGKVFLIEEGLIGEEFSYHIITNGISYYAFKSAQDNKTLFNFDQGPQTGGMGAVSPSLATESISRIIEEQLISRAIKGMVLENRNYTGILYLGGIIVDNQPINIEYNARWGDPECQVVLPSLKTDYLSLISACLNSKLNELNLEHDNKTRVCVIGASRGYPDNYSQVIGKRIYGLEKIMRMEGISVFGASIKIKDGKFYANGGRLFSVVAEGDNIIKVRQRAYAAISRISIEGNNLHYRNDIGWRDIERLKHQ